MRAWIPIEQVPDGSMIQTRVLMRDSAPDHNNTVLVYVPGAGEIRLPASGGLFVVPNGLLVEVVEVPI